MLLEAGGERNDLRLVVETPPRWSPRAREPARKITFAAQFTIVPRGLSNLTTNVKPNTVIFV